VTQQSSSQPGGADDPTADGQASAGDADGSQSPAQQPPSGVPTSGHAPQQPPNQGSSRGEGPIDGDLAEARRTLARSVRSLAERGATAEDPRRAREHLEAAREAAEALAALNR
jgi:hypothetical protein